MPGITIFVIHDREMTKRSMFCLASFVALFRMFGVIVLALQTIIAMVCMILTTTYQMLSTGEILFYLYFTNILEFGDRNGKR